LATKLSIAGKAQTAGAVQGAALKGRRRRSAKGATLDFRLHGGRMQHQSFAWRIYEIDCGIVIVQYVHATDAIYHVASLLGVACILFSYHHAGCVNPFVKLK
jgi:hypothetical protein